MPQPSVSISKKQPKSVCIRPALDELRRCIQETRALISETALLLGEVEEHETLIRKMRRARVLRFPAETR
jgi:hypothetical protein